MSYLWSCCFTDRPVRQGEVILWVVSGQVDESRDTSTATGVQCLKMVGGKGRERERERERENQRVSWRHQTQCFIRSNVQVIIHCKIMFLHHITMHIPQLWYSMLPSTFLNFLKFFSPLQIIPLSPFLYSLSPLLSPAALNTSAVLTISTGTSGWEELATPIPPPTRAEESGEVRSSLLVRSAKRPSLDT